MLKGRFEQLRNVTIKGFTIKPAAVSAILLQLPSLSKFKLHVSGAGPPAGRLSLPRSPSSTFSGTILTSEGCAALAWALQHPTTGCPDVAHLELQGNDINDEGYAALMSSLEGCLGIRYLGLHDDKINALSGAPKGLNSSIPSTP